MSILRKIFAVVIAMIVTGIVVGAVQKLGQNIYPLPVGADPENPEDIKNYIENAPFMALFFVIISYAAGALTGGFLSTFIAKDGKKIYAIIIGIIFLITSIYMMIIIPSPIWFWICGILVWLLVLVGWKIAVSLKRN